MKPGEPGHVQKTMAAITTTPKRKNRNRKGWIKGASITTRYKSLQSPASFVPPPPLLSSSLTTPHIACAPCAGARGLRPSLWGPRGGSHASRWQCFYSSSKLWRNINIQTIPYSPSPGSFRSCCNHFFSGRNEYDYRKWYNCPVVMHARAMHAWAMHACYMPQ